VPRKYIAPLIFRVMSETDRILRNFDDRIRELVSISILGGYRIRAIELEDATNTPIAHRIGRRVTLLASPPIGPSTSGRIEVVEDSQFDPDKYVVLKASGYGRTVTVDAWVF